MGGSTGYRDTWGWNLGFSAYWFATSYKWFILLIIALPGQVLEVLTREGLARGMTPEAAAAWAETVKDERWGWVVGIGAAWATVGPALFGSLSDRVRTRFGHRQPFIAIGAALTAVVCLWMGSAGQYWMLVVGFLLLQFSDDVGTGPYSAMVPEVVPEDRRGRASSVMSMLQLLGQLVSGIVAVALIMTVGGTAATTAIYVGVAAVNVVCAIVTLVTVRELRAGDAEVVRVSFIEMWVRPFRSADFRWVWFTRFINALGFYLVVTYLQYYLLTAFSSFELFGWSVPGSDREDVAQTATLLLALTLALTGAASSVFAARKADVIGRKKLIYVSGVVVFCALVPFAFVRDYTLAFYLAVVFGIGYGLYLSADWALVSDVLPNKDAAGTDMGVWQMSISSVQLFAGASGGLIGLLNRRSENSGYMAAIVLAGCLFLLSTILVRQVKGSR